MLPLTMAEMGVRLTSGRISGRDEVRRHLAELGLVVGEEIEIVSSLAGNLILSVKDSRIALDRGLCGRIFVKGDAK